MRTKVDLHLTSHEVHMIRGYMDALVASDEEYFKTKFYHHASWFMGLLVAAYGVQQQDTRGGAPLTVGAPRTLPRA